MIAASEPLEFVPHGRTVLAKHPGQIYGKQNTSASESSLLYKLSNFAIKDETLLVEKEDEEWWCVREVFYRETDEFEEEPTPTKDSKFDYNSESFRPSSRLKNDFNISIKSEILSKKLDADSNSGGSRTASANSSSNLSKKFNLNSGNADVKQKQLNPKTDSSYEEELYVKGCTAVWSKGLISTPATKLSGPEQRETISCYTIDTPIKHASFADFHIDIKNTMLIDALNSQIGDVKKNIKIEDTTEHIKTEIMPSIVLLDSKCMRVYATDGREYITSIPFQVKKVWPMKYGVLLEKDATPMAGNQSTLPASFFRFNNSHNSSFKSTRMNMSSKLRNDSTCDQDVPLPTCFSLTHPLDEVTPILIKSPSQGLQYYNDGDLQIIFVSTNPSIILIYDWKLATHSLWKIRKGTRDECLSMCPSMNTSTFSQTCDYIGSPMHSNRNVTSWATGLGSPYQSKKTPNTPFRSRLNSPMANVFHQQGLSPHASMEHASSISMMPNSAGMTPPSLPLYPDICLDHIWTDNLIIKRDAIEGDSDLKTFLHTDLVGHDYLCFIAKQNSVSKLQILRLQKSHCRGGLKTNLIVGTVSTVNAKDAVVLPHLKMMALIDEAGNIILQSGNNVVGKVHVGGVLARLIDSPYTKRSTFRSPFPRRSSLLPSRVNDVTFDDSALHLLSPVPHTTAASRLEKNESLGVSGLCDACGSRLTLQCEAGAMYRISLPALASSALVSRCCAACTAILPKDITMQVLIKWYGVRNAPGTQDLTPLQEWTMFSSVLLSLIGYSQRASETEHEHETQSKKQRTQSDGGPDDWQFMLNSNMHRTIGNPLATMLKLPQLSSESKHKHITEEDEKPGQFNANSLLFPYTLQILYAFHLVYEEIKLNTLLSNDLKPLATFLYQIAADLRLEKYVNHYWLDFPIDFDLDLECESQISAEVASKLVEPSYFSKEPPNVFSYMNNMFKDIDVGYYPYLADVNNLSKDLIEILSITGCGRSAGVQTITSRDSMASSTPRRRDSSLGQGPVYSQAVLAMCERGISPRDIDSLPPGLALACMSVVVVWACGAGARSAAPHAFARAAREELARHQEAATHGDGVEALGLEVIEKETAYSVISEAAEDPCNKSEESDSATGMEHLNTKLLKLLYPMDHRMTEVFNILQSSQLVTINLTQRPEVSDHDFIEEQEKYLYALSTRTMALPVARGMLTLRTQASSPTETASIPRVCVWGRGGAGRAAVGPPGGELGPPALAWPSFHSGAAAGLALLPTTGTTLDSTWLIYNKPKGTTEMSPEHAGFLMALGLNGHLKDMPFMNMYEYLVKCNEMLSVGLLLGLAATYRGTMDIQATKLMSIHLEPLLPPTSIELDIQQNILVCALLGVGLLYQGTEHHHYAQALLHEIGRVRVWSAERCVEREGYALSAGLALGMLLCGAGSRAPAQVLHALRTYMLGGELPESQRSGQKSTGVEGGSINLDVTSPGATLALGLVYLRSGARAPAAWLAPPATPYQLDYVRPDLLMLRVIARGLILWDEIEASDEWIENQVPDTIRPYCFVKPTEDNVDYEAMNQAYCNIIAGACFAMGIRFAGSGDLDARDAVLEVAKRLLRLAGRSRAELAGRATLECCLCVCVLAAAMIMAGRGDISVLRVCRRLRARVPRARASHPPLTHGGQMAVHMSVGLLFLMGGRGTLGTSRAAVPVLLAAFFPKFPTHTEDNRYHLQAFRHLYVLAVEPRLLLPRDLHTGKLCYAHIQVIDLKGIATELKAPCMIPELSSLQEVKINDPRYWPVSFHRDNNWDLLQKFLEHTWCIDVKQRAGCLSYVDDPQGFLTILAQTLTLDKSNIWSAKPEYIQLFTNDEKIRHFVKHYLQQEPAPGVCADCLLVSCKRRGRHDAPLNRTCECRRYSLEEQEYVQALSMVTYECLVRDMMCALPIWTAFLKIIRTMKTEPTSNNVWQMKLLLSQIEHHSRLANDQMKVDGQETSEPLISSEYTLAMKQKVSHILDNWELKLTPLLRKYLGLQSNKKLNSCEENTKKYLSAFIVYYDLQKNILSDCASDNELSVLVNKEVLSAEALSKVETLVR